MKKLYYPMVLLLLCYTATAQLSINQTSTEYLIDFDQTVAGVNNGVFTAPGTYGVQNPAPGQLDREGIQVSAGSGMGFNWSSPAPDVSGGKGQSNGAVSSGQAGVYAFSDDGGASRFFGFQSDGIAYSPGAVILRIRNNSGFQITQFNVSYTGKAYNDQNGSHDVDFYYSVDGSTWASIPIMGFSSSDIPSNTWESFLSQPS